jgi:hypothetical protein
VAYLVTYGIEEPRVAASGEAKVISHLLFFAGSAS